MRRITILMALAAAMAIVPTGCKRVNTTTPTLAAGAYNSTDQLLYQSLMAAQATINTLKSEIAANPSLKAPVNRAIKAYDVAEVAWHSYHSAVGTNPQASPAAAQRAVAQLQSSLAAATKGAAQ